MTARAILALVLAALAPDAAAAGEKIAIQASPVALNAADPSQRDVGPLVFRGGLALRSEDRRLGGLSDLAVSGDGQRLAAVSDAGYFLEARLLYDPQGFLSGIDGASLQMLRDTRGKPLEGKWNQDAESLARMGDGSFVVGFERSHRLWRYPSGPDGPAQSIAVPPGLDGAPANGGLETLVLIPPDRLLALTEESVRDGVVEGWLGKGGSWDRIGYRASGPLRPSGGCRLPSGDILVLERHYTPQTEVTARLRRLSAASIAPGAVLDGSVLATLARPLTVDNFEGLACRAGKSGETLLYLLSDDNFAADQRTLLLMFMFRDASPIRGSLTPPSHAAVAAHSPPRKAQPRGTCGPARATLRTS